VVKGVDQEYALSLSTKAQNHVWYLAEYKRVKLAHCPTGATTGGTGGVRRLMRAYHLPCFMRARLVPCMTGVLEHDFIQLSATGPA
jgi:hypothetical protein